MVLKINFFFTEKYGALQHNKSIHKISDGKNKTEDIGVYLNLYHIFIF